MNTATSTIERFYRDHHPAILKLVTRRVGDSHLAEDITADIFALALRSLTQGVEPRDPRAWLATIAANRVTTHW
ncbi:MAG: RNA polymerase sigma factor, partial [Pseudonocardiaceae bacterium]